MALKSFSETLFHKATSSYFLFFTPILLILRLLLGSTLWQYHPTGLLSNFTLSASSIYSLTSPCITICRFKNMLLPTICSPIVIDFETIIKIITDFIWLHFILFSLYERRTRKIFLNPSHYKNVHFNPKKSEYGIFYPKLNFNKLKKISYANIFPKI